MAAAEQEAQALSEFGAKLGAALSLEDTLSLLAVRVKRLVPHEAMAVYILRNKVLAAEFVNGENWRLLSSLKIPIGEGLAGWVAQNSKPILNGNPSVEPGYVSDSGKALRSALAVPLEGASSVVAVLAVYRSEADAFSRDDLNVLRMLGSKMGLSVEGALRGSAVAARAGR
jgi:GAF domain-containing protein